MEKNINRGVTGREGPPGREGEMGREGMHGEKGERGEPGVNAINSLTRTEFLFMRASFWAAVAIVLIMFITPLVLFGYPFKAITFVVPVEILNPGNKIACNGTIHLKTYYKKYVSTPGLTIRTLGYMKNGVFYPLDSSTVVSNMPKGNGEVKTDYVLAMNPEFVGKNRIIIFSIYHWLFGFRPVVEQYESEPFEITKCLTTKK